MQKKEDVKKKSEPHITILAVLAIFLILVSVFTLFLVGNKLDSKTNEIVSSLQEPEGVGKVSLIITEKPTMSGEVSVIIEPTP